MFLRQHDKTAIIWKEEEISYTRLLQRIDSYSGSFPGNSGGKVAIFSENRPEWVYAFYAVWKNGSIAVPVDFMSTAEDVAYILEDCKPGLIFCSRHTSPVLEEACKGLSYTIHVIVFEDMAEFEEEGRGGELPEPDLHSTAVIIYTSGTTGSAKGVMLSYDNLLANMESVSREVEIFTGRDNVMVLLPLHHVFPLVGTMLAPLYVGGHGRVLAFHGPRRPHGNLGASRHHDNHRSSQALQPHRKVRRGQDSSKHGCAKPLCRRGRPGLQESVEGLSSRRSMQNSEAGSGTL